MSRYVKIGLFVTLTGIGTILYVMQTAEFVGTGRTYTVHAYVDDASGLLIDSNVRLAGVDVGRLTAIELDGSRARLTLEIRESVELYEDAVVAKATESLLGTATVSINPGTGVGGLLGDGDTVRNVQQSATISDAVGNANVLAANAAALVEEINTYLTDEGTVQALNEIVMVIREAAISTSALLEQNLLIARSTMQNIQSFSARLDDSSIQQLESVQEILNSTASLTARLDSLVGENDQSMAQSIRSIEENLAGLQVVINSLQASADNVQEITRVVRDGEGNVGRLINDDELYTRVVRITEEAEGFLDSIGGLGVQLDFRSEFLVDQLETKDRFNLRLVPRQSDRFYTAGVVSTPVPTRTEETTVTTTSSGGTTTVETRNEQVSSDDLKFNLQLARIWGPLTARAGVFESTAGVGLDLQPVDRFALSAEAFDFGADDGVYLRGYGTLYPFYDPESNNPLRWIYLAGGVDDAMDIYQRDFFVSAGVRFTDDNLRSLVSFIPLN